MVGECGLFYYESIIYLQVGNNQKLPRYDRNQRSKIKKVFQRKDFKRIYLPVGAVVVMIY